MSLKEWAELCETMAGAADGYAATDSGNAYLYRREAAEFCQLDCPGDRDQLAVREAEAAMIRRQWSERLRGGKQPQSRD